MSDYRDLETPSWDDAQDDADRAVADMKESLHRLRGQVGAYRLQIGDNDNRDPETSEEREA